MSQQQDVIAEFLKGLKGLQEKNFEAEEEQSYGKEHLDKLREACKNLLKKEYFEVGQIVKWKKDLKNRRLPCQNQPAIVLKVLDEPIVSSDNEPGSPYFLEKLDIVLGVISKDGTFLTFYYDSSRFESY